MILLLVIVQIIRLVSLVLDVSFLVLVVVMETAIKTVIVLPVNQAYLVLDVSFIVLVVVKETAIKTVNELPVNQAYLVLDVSFIVLVVVKETAIKTVIELYSEYSPYDENAEIVSIRPAYGGKNDQRRRRRPSISISPFLGKKEPQTNMNIIK